MGLLRYSIIGTLRFFALGGYMIGMWLMFARTKLVVGSRC